MNKQTFENVKNILTSHHVYANGTDYSLSFSEHTFDDFEYYRIEVYSNYNHGSFHDGFAMFFCEVARIAGCACSFRSENNVCVCNFY
ncbi:MAG: hypothetical protein IJ421_04435 [Prevotella sp.]|nr:hypothetical protein [Prevotella sp.]